MVRIAICDDDAATRSELHLHLKNREHLMRTRFEIKEYASGEDFISDLGMGESFHIVFMDIMMHGIDGVRVGERLRKKYSFGKQVALIYISAHDGYYEDIVDNVGAFRFLHKPFNRELLHEVVNDALEYAISIMSVFEIRADFEIKVGTSYHRVETQKIAYLRNEGRKIKIYVWDHAMPNQRKVKLLEEYYGKISEEIEKLPKHQFVQCERSFIANLECVRLMESKFILLDQDQTEIPISKYRMKEVKQAYINYVRIYK